MEVAPYSPIALANARTVPDTMPGAAFEQVDVNLIYAGQTLGMSDRKIFWKVIIPAAAPGIVSGTSEETLLQQPLQCTLSMSARS